MSEIPFPGAQRIAAERKRQIETKGWAALHDDRHQYGELAWAAVCYAFVAAQQAEGQETEAFSFTPEWWPFESGAWKPSEDPVRNLEKAGALIAAEIDRLLRVRSLAGDRGRG